MDGFWLPRSIRESVLAAGAPLASLTQAHGLPARPGDPAGVEAEWPQLSASQWGQLLAALQGNRQRLPGGPALWGRLQQALAGAGQRLADPRDPLHQRALAALSGYTGYSAPMIRFALQAMDLMALDQLPRALALSPTGPGGGGWQAFNDLPGRWQFYPKPTWRQSLRRLTGGRGGSLPWEGPVTAPGLVVGYGAGNVPGTALLITFLGLASALVADHPPAILVKNSRQEPIFAPLVLNALEEADPDLLSSVAVLIWDYEDAQLQRRLLSQADLVIAAASDQTIAQIQQSLARARSGPARFHAHGHKVSFSAIGREMLVREAPAGDAGGSLLDAVARLAALDSVFWDQNGCLSSRVHFVEVGDQSCSTPADYARALAAQLRQLAMALPRGAWPRNQLHDRFDRYKLLETGGQVQVLSSYDEPFVVVLDERALDGNAGAIFRSTVNDCQGRVVIVRPVADLMEAPDRYLPLFAAGNLQSLSVAVGRPGEGLTPRFLTWAAACGRCGVTAIRTVGRGAFPQLAYSWDGLMPLDLVRARPAGHFTTIEFEAPYEQILATYRMTDIMVSSPQLRVE